MSDKILHGWYSESADMGYAIYETPDGKEVAVTEVTAGDTVPASKFPDLRYVGVVERFVKSVGEDMFDDEFDDYYYDDIDRDIDDELDCDIDEFDYYADHRLFSWSFPVWDIFLIRIGSSQYSWRKKPLFIIHSKCKYNGKWDTVPMYLEPEWAIEASLDFWRRYSEIFYIEWLEQ